MTLVQIREYISYLVDDLEMTYFTPTQLNVFINQSLKEAQKLLTLAGNNWYVKLVSRATVQQQRDYMLPCNCLYIHRLELRQGTGTNVDRQVLSRITLNQQDDFATYAEPIGFYLEKDYLILCPIPQDNTKTMYMWVTTMVDDVSADSDVPNIPPEYVEYLAQKAASLCFVKDDRQMDNILPVFTETEKRLKAAAIERIQSQASSVVVTHGNGLISF